MIHILLIEADAAEAARIRDLLVDGDSDQCRVAHVERLSDALQALAEAPYDAILLSSVPTGARGANPLVAIQAAAPDCTIVILTDREGEVSATRLLEEGAQDTLIKEELTAEGLHNVLRHAMARKRAERTFRQNEMRFSNILNMAHDAIISIGEAQRIFLFNQGAERIFGYQADEVIGRPLNLLMPARFARIHQGYVDEFAAAPEMVRMIGRRGEVIGRRKDGTEFPAEASISKLIEGGKATFTAILRDVTDRKAGEAVIQKLAYSDPLTGFPNRAFLQEHLREAILGGQRLEKSVALLLIDLDRFREINDTLGHRHGDLLLRQLALRLKEVLREQDVVARLGGDEFAVVMLLAESKHAVLVAKKVLGTIEAPLPVEGLPVRVEASIGIALFPDHGESAEILFQRADVAMYRAKQIGSGYLLYDPKYDQHDPLRLTLMGELPQAIESDHLVLYYQPKVDLKTRRVIGVEALVRWRHPVRGFIAPDQFILPAEQTGLIRPLTLWVFRAALLQCQQVQLVEREISIAVNLSARNLHDPQLPEKIAVLLKDVSRPFGQIEMEITESAIMADPSNAREALQRLRDLGIRFSIDDFGTGYSSLAYLKKLPVDAVKIDKSFTINMLANRDDAVIVKSTIDMVHDLGLKVIAEGVETREALDYLTALGCDAAQGYYISRPLPAEESMRWLAESSWGRGDELGGEKEGTA
ncbi:MAG: EAL domain-containing protein [Candidatus Manganitrophaceae bacterium]|nr:MAG: EAL domain-containing protein [Candidatus Manganitrophaceae bacterium]